MALVKHKEYPAFQNYKGKAYTATIGFHSLRLPYIDDVINWIVKTAVEAQVWLKDGELIKLDIWMEESSWKGIPTYRWIVEWTYYIKTLSYSYEIQTLGWQAIVYGVLAILTIVALVFFIKQVKELVWGYGGEVPEGETIFDKIGKMIMYGGFAFAGTYLLVYYLKKRRAK